MVFHKDGLLENSTQSHSPHNLIPKLIEPKSVILDVGCNTGYIGKKMKAIGVITDGVDINKEALQKAKKFYRNIYLRDLYDPTLRLPQQTYDYIVFGDILEHLPRPDRLLLDAKHYLNKK